MIAYLRTMREGVTLMTPVLEGIPHMVIKSRRTEVVDATIPDMYMEAFNMSHWEAMCFVPVEVSNRVIVIESSRLQDVKVRELMHNVRGARWTTIDGMGQWGDEWAYRDQKGRIVFRLPLMRKTRTFRPDTASESHAVTVAKKRA